MKRRHVSRKTKALIYMIVIFLLGAALYISKGCPTLTFRQEFRRAEKSQMVGPSKIADELSSQEYHEFDDMLVGETDYGVCFFGRRAYYRSSIFEDKRYDYTFTYREKADDITVLAAPNKWGVTWDWEHYGGVSLPVYIFTEYPEAVSADLTLTISGTTTGKDNEENIPTAFTQELRAQASTIKEGVLRCYIQGSTPFECRALALLSDICGNTAFYISEDEPQPTILCTVTLLDASNQVIATKEMQLTQFDTAVGEP